MSRTPAWIVPLVLLVSGCVTYEEVPETPTVRSLADFLNCNGTYPDGKPLPCTRMPSGAPSHLGGAWYCVAEYPDARGPLGLHGRQVLSDLGGGLALRIQLRGEPSGSVIASEFILKEPTHTSLQDLNVPGDETRFYVTFQKQDADRDVRISYLLYAFHLDPVWKANKTAFDSWWLSVPVTHYQGSPWFQWIATGAGQRYGFSSMNRTLAGWAPEDLSIQGADFEVEGTVTGPERGEVQATLPKDYADWLLNYRDRCHA